MSGLQALSKFVRVLLVEDDATFAKAIGAALSRNAKFEVETLQAFSLSEASSLIVKANVERKADESIDVILLDLNLPDSQGLDTFIDMRNTCSGLPIIVLTGRDDEELAMSAMQQGAQDYLVKGDINGRTLSRAISYAIERAKIMAEREDFVATLTHDLKGPLQGANRILGLLVKGDLGTLSGDQSELLQRLADSNSTLLEMISNLLEVYRYDKDLHKISFQHTNLVNLVRNCMSEVEHFADARSIEIESEISDGEEIAIMADESSIARVIRNLLDNALKFTPKGGKVTIGLLSGVDKVRLAVSDTGPGISDEDRRYLFERFYRGATGRGYSRSTGLGLYLCRQIVQHHHGTITCDPSAGKGSSFVLEFPRI
jgi:signal transduction histidine kinase